MHALMLYAIVSGSIVPIACGVAHQALEGIEPHEEDILIQGACNYRVLQNLCNKSTLSSLQFSVLVLCYVT